MYLFTMRLTGRFWRAFQRNVVREMADQKHDKEKIPRRPRKKPALVALRARPVPIKNVIKLLIAQLEAIKPFFISFFRHLFWWYSTK